MRRIYLVFTRLLAMALVASTLVIVGPDPAAAQTMQANDDTVEVAEGGTVIIEVLDNDSIPLGGDPTLITAITRDPASGTATITGRGTTVTFDAPLGFAGAEFIYEISDGRDNSRATVTVTPADPGCGDITLTPADGGAGLEAAIVSTNRCLGPQTIWLERGQYITPFDFTAIDDDLSIVGLDPDARPEIINSIVGSVASTFRVSFGATVELRSLRLLDPGASSVFVHATSSQVLIENVDLIGSTTHDPVDGLGAVRGDGATLTIRNSTISDADATAVLGTNGTTLVAESLEITAPERAGIDVDMLVDLTDSTISGGVAGVALTGARSVEAIDTTISLSKVGIDLSAAQLVELTRVTVTDNAVGMTLTDTSWIAQDVGFANADTDCVLSNTTLTDLGGNTDSDNSCFPRPNQVPVAVLDEVSASPGVPISIDVLANDTDPDADALTVTSTTSPNATVAVDSLSLDYIAPAGFTGELFSYTVSDGFGGSASADVRVGLSCPDVTLTPADGGTALVAAVQAADDCPGAQTIFLEPGEYRVTGRMFVNDELVVLGTDAANPSMITLVPTNTQTAEYVFWINAEAERFRAANIGVVGNPLIAFARFDSVDAVLDNISYRGGSAACTQSTPVSISFQGGSLVVTDSSIINGNCAGIQATNATQLTVSNTEIANSGGHGIRAVQTPVTVTTSHIFGSSGQGIWADQASPLAVSSTYLYSNTANGVSAGANLTVTDSWIGLRPDGADLFEAGNGANGILNSFGDITIINTVVAHSAETGVFGQQDPILALTITNSEIRDNGSAGLRSTANNRTIGLEGTTFSGNQPNCAFQATATIVGTGNTSDDDSCPFGIPNQEPVAQDDQAAVAPGATLVIDVLDNDSDPDSDPDGDELTITSTTSANVAIAPNGQYIEYTAPADFSGELFGYTIADGDGATASADVQVDLLCTDITVTPADGGPALTAAVAAANDCPGAQTIFLEPGPYPIANSLTIDDELTIAGTDVGDPAVISLPSFTFQSIAMAFLVNPTAGRFTAANLEVAGSRLVSLGGFDSVTTELNNVTYTGGSADCNVSLPTTMLVVGGSLTLRDSRIIDGNCGGISSYGEPILMIIDSEISGVGGFGVSSDDGDVTVIGSQIHNNSRHGIKTGGTVTIDDSYIYSNGADGVDGDVAITVTNSWIGLRPAAGGLVAAPNGGAGIYSVFADLTVDNSVVAHNSGGGLKGPQQAVWAVDITNSTIRDNATFGLELGAGSAANRTATDTEFSGNDINCQLVFGASALTDGGGNSSDDDSCPFSVVNEAPTISFDPISIQVVAGNQASTTATVVDVDTPLDNVTVTAELQDTDLGSVQVTGEGATRTITVTAAAGQTGASVVVVTLSDGASTGDHFVPIVVVDVPTCVPLEDLVGDAFSASMFPVRIIEACAVPTDDVPSEVHDEDLFIEVIGEFVFDALGDLAPTITIGDVASSSASPNLFTFTAVVDPNGNITPWDVGPISVAYDSAPLQGFVVDADFTIAGYDNSLFDGTIDGSATVEVDLPGVATGDLTAELSGFAYLDDNEDYVVDLGVEVSGRGGVVDGSNAPILIDELDGDLYIVVRTQIDNDAAEPITGSVDVTVNSLDGVGSLLLVDDEQSELLELAVEVRYEEPGQWQVDLAPSTDLTGLGWFQINNATGMIAIDSSSESPAISGQFTAAANVDLGDGTLTSIGLATVTASLDDSILHVDFSGDGTVPAWQAGADAGDTPLFIASDAPWSLTGGVDVDLNTGTATVADLAVAVGPTTAQLFPGWVDTGFSVAASTVTATIDGGAVTATATSVNGTFGPTELEIDGPVELNLGRDETVLLSVPRASIITGGTAAEVLDVTVFTNGSVTTAGGCLDHPTAWLDEQFGLAELIPVNITEICVLSGDAAPTGVPAGAAYAVISGSYDLSALADLQPVLRIGDGPENTFQDLAAIRLDSGEWQLWNTGTITMGFEASVKDSVTTAATVALGGYINGVFDPSVAGSGSAIVDLPGIVTADLTVSIDGAVTSVDSTTSLVADVTITADVGATVPATGLVALDDLTAGVSLALSATRLASGDYVLDADLTLLNASGSGRFKLDANDDEAVLGGDVAVTYAAGVWTVEVTGDAAAGDLDWFAATSFSGAFTIRPGAIGGFAVDGLLTGQVAVDFDGEDNGAGAINIAAEAVLSYSDGLIDVAFRATNPEPLDFTLGELLTLDGASIEIIGAVSYDVAAQAPGPIDLVVTFDAVGASLFEFTDDVEEGGNFAVAVVSPQGRLDGSGLSVSTAGIAGRFGEDTVSVGATTLTIKNSDERYQVFTATTAVIESGDTTVTVSGLVVWSDGTFDTGGVCAENDEGLLDETFALGGVVPFDITSVCVLDGDLVLTEDLPDDAIYAHVTGFVDLSALDEYNPVLEVGAQSSAGVSSITVSIIRLPDGTIRPWDAGPIALGLGPVEANGVLFDGRIDLGGYVDGDLVGSIAGEFDAELTLDGVGAASLTGSVAGSIDDDAGTLVAQVNLAASGAAGDPSASFIELSELDVVLDVALSAAFDDNAGWSTTGDVSLVSAAGSGTVIVADEDGAAGFGADLSVDYEAGIWELAATGAAFGPEDGWLGFTDAGGAITIDTTDGFQVAGSLSAAARIDIDGAGQNEPVDLNATVTFVSQGSLLTVDFDSTVSGPSTLSIDPVFDVSDLTLELAGQAVVELGGTNGITVVSFDVAAGAAASQATLFGGLDDDGFAVVATDINGYLDGVGLRLDVHEFSGQFGPDVHLTIGAATLQIQFAPDGVYEVVRVGFAELAVDGNTTVTVTDVVVFSDGEVMFGEACVGNGDGLIGDTLGLAGVLPFDITEACVTNEGDQVFYAVSGTFDLSGLDGLLGADSTVTLTVGGDQVDASTGTFSFELVQDDDGIRPWNFGPFDLEIADVEAGPFGASMQLHLGGYQSGALTGLYAADAVPAEAEREALAGGSFTVSLEVEADGADVGAGIGAALSGYAIHDGDVQTLVIGGRLEGSGRVLVDNFGIAVEDLGADFGVQLQLDLATREITVTDPSFGQNAGAERLFLGLGFVTLEATGVDLFRTPGELVDFESITLAFTDDAGPLDGWSGSVDDISVRYSDDHGVEVCAGPEFATSVTAGEEPDLFAWLPLSISQASFEIPEAEPAADGSCESVLDRFGDFADATITSSLRLAIGGPDDSIIDASVDAITIELPLLVDYAEWFTNGAQGTPPQFPVTGLQGASFGLAPTDFGPLTLGGQIGIGFVLDENNQPVWYGRMAAAVQWNNIGLSLDIGLSQLGPMWATIATPITIPLGPTGFTISGIGGGLLFDEAARLPTIDIGCVSNGGEQEGDDVPEGEGCVDSLALVRLPAFELAAPRNNDDILQAVRNKAAQVNAAADQGTVGQAIALIPKQMTLYIQGSINHATGLIDGTVKLGANIDIAGEGVIPDLAILGKGEVSFLGFEAGELGIIMDYANPIDPTIAVALGVPGDGTLASFFPGESTFGGTYVTEGLYSAPILVARELLRDPSALPGGSQVMAVLAQRLEADRTRPLAVFVLDINKDGVVDDGENDGVIITEAFLTSRLATMMGVTDPNFEDQIADDAVFLAKLAEVVVADIFDALANGAPQSPIVGPQPLQVDPDEAVAAFLELSRNTMLGVGGAADRGIDFVLLNANPGFELRGEAGLNIFGFPVGPQSRIELSANKDALSFGFNGSLAMMTNAMAATLIQDDTMISFVAPWDLDGLVAAGLDGQLPTTLPLDPVNGDWAAGFESQGLMAGLPFTATGFIAPAGQADFVNDKLTLVEFEPSHDPSTALSTEGGAFFDFGLSIPRMFSDPADLIETAIDDQCFTFNFENVFANLEKFPQYQACVEALTATDPLGGAQFYAPNPGNAIIDALEGLEFNEDGLPPEFVPQVLAAFDGWYMRGHVDEFELFGFPVIDTASNPDNGTFIVDQTGVTFALQPGPLLTQVDDDSYQLNVRLPFLSGEGKPLPVVFDVVDGPIGPVVVPRLGLDTMIDGAEINALFEGLGMGGNGFGSLDSVHLRAFTPGYDNDGDALQQSGGVQVAATGMVDGLLGLVDAPPSTMATATLTLTPPSPGNLLGADVSGTITLDGPAMIGAVTLTGGTFSVEYNGNLQVDFAGSATLPDIGDVDVSGSINVGDLSTSLTISSTSLRIDAAEVSGSMTLVAQPTSWSIEVKGLGRDSATVTFDGWATAAAKSVTIGSAGFEIDELELPDFGSDRDAVWVDKPTMSASFDTATGQWSASLGGIVHATIGEERVEIDLATIDLDDFALPAGGDESFEHTFAQELALGTLDLGTASLTIGRTSNGVLFAELDALVAGAPFGLEGALQVTDLRVDSTGAVSGMATLGITEPVQTTIALTISTVLVDSKRVVEFRSGESWFRTNGTWSLDVASLPTITLGPGGSASPIQLISGSLSRTTAKSANQDVITFDGVVKVKPLDAFVTVGGTYNMSTRTLDAFTSSESVQIGPLEFSGRVDVEASPGTWKLVIASGSSTATVAVDGWGSATINGVTIDNNGSFEADLEFPDLGDDDDLVWIDEPSLAVSFVPGQELNVVVGGVAWLNVDGPGSEQPCVVLGNAHLFDDNDCFDLGNVIDFDMPAGSSGDFSHTFEMPLEIGDFDFGDATATVERYGNGTLALELTADANISVSLPTTSSVVAGWLPIGLSGSVGVNLGFELESARFVQPMNASGNVFGSGSAEITAPFFNFSVDGALRVQNDKVRIDFGDLWLRTDGAFGLPNPLAPPSLFTRAQPDIEVIRDFDQGGSTRVFFSVWIDDEDNDDVELSCTVNGSSVDPWSVTSTRERFRPFLAEGNHTVVCEAELDGPINAFDRIESVEFMISVVRDIPVIGFAKPADFLVALANPNSAGLAPVYFPVFGTTHADQVRCEPTRNPAGDPGGSVLLGLGSHVVTCVASNDDAGAVPVTRSFAITVVEQLTLGTIGFLVTGDTPDEPDDSTYASVGQIVADVLVPIDLTPEGEGSVTHNDTVEVTGDKAQPGTQVRVAVFSERFDAGSTIVDDQGRWSLSFTIPSDFPLGTHTLEIRSTDGQGTVRADYLPLFVEAASPGTPVLPVSRPTTGADSDPPASGEAPSAQQSTATRATDSAGSPLAHTGTESRALLQLSLLVIAFGAFFAGSSRRWRLHTTNGYRARRQ